MTTQNQQLSWVDFSALATWIAEEIGGAYYMDKKSCEHQLIDAPFHFHYRVPVTLWHEERTLLALFIERIFWGYWESGFRRKSSLRRIFQYLL